MVVCFEDRGELASNTTVLFGRKSVNGIILDPEEIQVIERPENIHAQVDRSLSSCRLICYVKSLYLKKKHNLPEPMIVYFEEREEFVNHSQFTNRFRTAITVNGQVLVDYEYIVSPNKKTPLQIKDKDGLLYPGTRLIFVF